MKLLVTGREGQLARSLAERAAGHELTFLARPELDLACPDEVREIARRALRESGAEVLVSAAAHTAVDKAEDEPELAHAVNALSAGELAAAARDLDLPIIHISTDYVFDGTKDGPYEPDDPVAPLGAYGRSKEAGERAVREANPRHVIIRTAWVYSPFGNNFVRTMLRLAETRERISVVDDQHGCPTSALDLADGVFAAASGVVTDGNGVRGTHHYAGAGETTWAGLARAVFEQARRRGLPHAAVDPIPGSAFPTKARRPDNSRLDCTGFAKAFGAEPDPWEAALDAVMGHDGAFKP